MSVNAQNGPSDQLDYVLVGGGLQNALIALAVFSRNPLAKMAMIEKQTALGGNHTWCFHESDLAPELRAIVAPLVVRRWPGHEVLFPKVRRTVAGSYAMVSSERLHEVVSNRFAAAPNGQIFYGETVTRCEPGIVETVGGRILRSKVVVDARGPSTSSGNARAFQKFVGLEVDLAEDCSFLLPRIMDAAVEQLDGFRFVYMLPLGPRRLLIEDTYYSVSPDLDQRQIESRICLYAEHCGMKIDRVGRREYGVLPLPVYEERSSVVSENDDGVRVIGGYRGGWFHPTTGYSFPVAATLAEYLMMRGASDVRAQELNSLVQNRQKQARFAIRLNQLLFGAFAPERAYGALERFYQLPEETIRRFYAMQTTRADRLRIICGRPPSGFSPSKMFHSLRRGVLA